MYELKRIEMRVEKIAFSYFLIFTIYKLTDRQNVHRIDAHICEKIAFPPKPDGHTYRQTDGRT